MSDKSIAIPQRKDRWVTDEDWMRSMLMYELFCVVGSTSGDQVFMRPSAFYYDPDDHAIYVHGAHHGRSFDNAKENNKLTVCVYNVGAMRVHRRAFEFLQEHAGVIAFGTASIEQDNAKKHAVMRATFAKHAPHLKVDVDYDPPSQDEIDETTVVKISIDEWSGKMKWTDDPTRERFHYDDVLGDRRPHLPWYFDMSEAEALTAEWKASRTDKDEGAQ